MLKDTGEAGLFVHHLGQASWGSFCAVLLVALQLQPLCATAADKLSTQLLLFELCHGQASLCGCCLGSKACLVVVACAGRIF
jgi:hypothetical protein